MFFLSRIGCLFNRHEPDRRKVTWGGHAYVGHCLHCGAPIERRARRDWRRRVEARGGSPDASA